MAPSFCAINNCGSSHKKKGNIFIKQIKSLKFFKKGTDEYKQQEELQKCILSFRDPKSKEDGILSQIHRGNCGICEKHFKASDIVISKFVFLLFTCTLKSACW